MSMLHYISHPEVDIDPDIPVPQWRLSVEGRARAVAMLDRPWVGSVVAVFSSAETKATETAGLLADHLGLTVEVRPRLGEVDRSSTGFVPHRRHEELADRLFAEPTTSADGWERAVDAQDRVVAAAADLIGSPPEGSSSGDVVIVGHGGVGTLLYCRLTGEAIDRRLDQQGFGNRWAFDRDRQRMVHGWSPIDGDDPA